MTADTITSTLPVAAKAVAKHNCADRGCPAAMVGLALDDAAAGDAEEAYSSS